MSGGAGHLLEVFAANRPALLRFVTARRQSHNDAEDIMQELWIKVASTEIGELGKPLSYIYRMAENLILDHGRTASARQRRETEWTGSQIEGSFDEPIDSQPSAERVLLARDHLRRVNQVLGGLSANAAYIFRQVRFEGCGQQEVADRMNLSLSSVEKHLRTALTAVLVVKDEPDTD